MLIEKISALGVGKKIHTEDFCSAEGFGDAKFSVLIFGEEGGVIGLSEDVNLRA